MAKEKIKIGSEGIYDSSKLGAPKQIVLGLQHMFAMFGATVLVPLLTGLPVSTTLLMAGLGTLLFHLLTRGKIPAFLGSSFAFLGGYAAVAPKLEDGSANVEMLPYACLGVAVAGLVYLILAALIKIVGIKKVMRFFPPVVTGPIIIAIGLILAPTAVSSCTTNWLLALVALAIIIIFNIWGRGMAKIIPIILGIFGAYALGLVLYFIAEGNPDLIQSTPWLFAGGSTVNEAGQTVYTAIFNFDGVKEIIANIGDGKIWGNLVGLPIYKDYTILGVDWGNSAAIFSSIIAIAPIALATMMEHIGDISAISATTGKNFIANPGLHRSLTGDGLATTFSSLFGGPANTTYGENTGVLALTKVYDPKVIRIAAYFAVGFSFFPLISALIATIPSCVIGGVSFVLYGMISSIGIRNMVENKVDLTKSRNLIISAVILVAALGINSVGGISFAIADATITLSGLAVAAIAGIIINAILPGKDYDFKDDNPQTSTEAVNFAVGANSKRQEKEKEETK